MVKRNKKYFLTNVVTFIVLINLTVRNVINFAMYA